MFGRFGSIATVEEVPVRIEPKLDVATGKAPEVEEPSDGQTASNFQRKMLETKMQLHRRLIDEINLSAIEKASRDELRASIQDVVRHYIVEKRVPINASELSILIDELIDEMTGLGPIEPLLKDPTINDILINTHENVYVERFGLLEKVPLFFKDEAHLIRIINRIVAAVGRRVDESQPLCDARLG